ncbi:MAG: cyclase family protein [Proteobacteria bacterium]|nr:cyclase family protein [Pseudomonadota bacterium]
MELISVKNAIWLSHTWGATCPAYGGGARIQFESIGSIAGGDASNSLKFSASNHIGTHVDAPQHFVADGRAIDSYSPAELCFFKPFILDVIMEASERYVSISHLEALRGLREQKFLACDLLLIRTGAEVFRTEERYWKDGYGLDLGLADYIRLKAPNCRGIGIDTISITSFSDRPRGRLVHREFLGGDPSFLLVEDMALGKIGAQELATVIIAPLRIENGDGAPVSVMGFLG